ncbi:MAG: hypothetical protein ACJA0N_000764 [Pseudohongiellaceae bacterium]|jgi:hypothetical protein
MTYLCNLFILFSVLLFSSSGWASEEDEMAAMQKELNAEVLAQPFDAADVAKIDAYIDDALKNKRKPEGSAPSYWRQGYTCASIRRYHYRYNAYRNCLYHYRYYGRYW